MKDYAAIVASRITNGTGMGHAMARNASESQSLRKRLRKKHNH